MSNRVKPAVHGALDFAELEQLGLDPNEVLDFSVNSNPFGTPPLILEALRSVHIERYPDRESIALRHALSERLEVSPEQVLVGNGTAELIQLAAFAFLQKGDHALIVEPTFGEYERSIRLREAHIHRWRASSRNGFVPNPGEIRRRLKQRNMQVVFICNPNNPTGQILPTGVLGKWADEYPETCFLVDEAYLAFAEGMKSAISLQKKNIVVLCSMTKDYAIAGLRLGYTVGEPKMIEAMKNFRPAWNVSALAQAAGLAALQSDKYISETLARLRNEKEILISGLRKLGYEPVPSQTNYFLLPVGNGTQFRIRLLQQGIIVRDCASFGLRSFVRIATRRPEENTQFLSALHSQEKEGQEG
jgi:histidinol-phosphate aminotransferase